MNAVVDNVEPAEKQPTTISEIIAKLFEIRAKRKEISEKDSDLVAEWERLETVLLGKLEEQGSVRVSSKLGTASIGEQLLPIVEDWDAFYEYIAENNAFHLLQRRPAVGAYRELVEADANLAAAEAAALGVPVEELPERPPVVPGARPITKKSINLRAGT